MTARPDKRRRNTRSSRYRPRTEAQKQRRRELWETRAEERQARRDGGQEAIYRERLEALEIALREQGQGGVHGRRSARPLDEIDDDAERLAVLKARVERLERLWSINQRKRETRGKIIIGGALLAELIDGIQAGDLALLDMVLDVLDRRVDTVRDRLTVKELLGNAPLPLRPGGDVAEPLERALSGAAETEPDFDALVQSAMAEEVWMRPGEIDPDYAELDDGWRLSP